ETIARIFHENPKLAWEFLDVQQPSAERIAEIRKSELLEAADTDPRPLRQYVIIGAKKLMRRLNRLIDKSMTNTRAPLTPQFLELQMAGTTLRYIDDIGRRQRRKK